MSTERRRRTRSCNVVHLLCRNDVTAGKNCRVRMTWLTLRQPNLLVLGCNQRGEVLSATDTVGLHQRQIR